MQHLNPASFYQTFWGEHALSEYQEAILDSMIDREVDTVIIPRARACGTTTALTIGLLYLTLMHERHNLLVISGHHGIREVLAHSVRSLALEGNEVHAKYGLSRMVVRHTKDTVELLNGSRLMVRAPSPTVGRGLSVNTLVYSDIPERQEPELNANLMPCLGASSKFIRVHETVPIRRRAKIFAAKPIDLVMSDEHDSFIRRM